MSALHLADQAKKCDITLGKLSLKKDTKKAKSISDNNKANNAGTMNHWSDLCLAQTAKTAPINGPMIKPNENAIPTNA